MILGILLVTGLQNTISDKVAIHMCVCVCKLAQSLCGEGAVYNEAYLHRGRCHFAQNDQLKYGSVATFHLITFHLLLPSALFRRDAFFGSVFSLIDFTKDKNKQ